MRVTAEGAELKQLTGLDNSTSVVVQRHGQGCYTLGTQRLAVKGSSSSPPTLRFGVFELDSRAGELRKKGMKIRLQGQPVDILVMLLQRPGETVTREELQKKLWPADTFVDFEQGLNNAMKRLRAALDDDSDNPRFVETLPRHGYRFIGSVNGSEQTRAAEAKATGTLGPILRFSAFGTLAVIAVAAVLVGLDPHGWRDRIFARHVNPTVQALAVLPLANLSGDPEQEYFADGMTEALITELGKITSPRVISRQSVIQYKGSKKPLQEIAHELNVDALLEGAVERSGDHVHVTVHLVRTSPESQLWAKEYSRSIRDVMALEDEIAHTVTDEIQTKLTPDERTRLASSRPVDPEAHDDYLRGRYLLGLASAHHSKFTDKRQYTELDILTALGHFKQAIKKDPAYALAYTGLADAYIEFGNPVWGNHSPKETLSDAKAAAIKALELDPSLAEAHFSLAQTLEYDWNWSEAEKEYRLALKLNPNYADAHLEYGRFVQALRRNDEAITQMNSAIELDPFGIKTRVVVAYVTYASRQYDLAVKQFESLGDDWGLILAYREKEMYPKAIAAWQRWKVSHPSQRRHPHVLAVGAGLYGLEGRKREAQALIDELRETARHHHVSGFFLAEAYLGLGEKDKALTWLERAYEEHDQWMVFANSYPGLDRLRSEPRFQALLRRVNFPQ
jgi:TolB-like protein/DNA-binding winged helix-turn-helix (wHTH) protein/Tfp pilus assembly protein PilF